MKISQLLSITAALLLSTASCQEDSFAPETPTSQSGINRKTTGDGGIDDFSDHPNPQRIQYPTIIHQTFVPGNDLFDHTKCLTWRIEWPDYSASVDANKVATVFSINNGALNSFDYLNNVAPAQTHNAQFSLYHDAKLQIVSNMWMHLDHYAGANEITRFAKVNYSPASVEEWVKERPGLLETKWPGGDATELEYQEGDIIFFTNDTQGLYGGIRIVSMTPRIIEVYLAVENN